MSFAAFAGSGFPAQNLSFQFRDGDRTVGCTITREVLLDLGSHHGISFTDDEVRSVLLPELNRLASLKYAAGRLEENGELVIRTADLLRYGFERAA